MTRKYDIIIFGATGFTGKYCVEDVVKLQQEQGQEEPDSKLHKTFTWAIAGRSDAKLEQVLRDVYAFTGVDVTKVDRIHADVTDADSLRQMAADCSVVVNCVGPYRFYGENVIKACLMENTSHVDISGEQQYLERTQIAHHKSAEKAGVYIIGSCGFDSIPADCGTTYLQQNFEGDLNSVDCYLETDSHGKPARIHYGTYLSIIHYLAHLNEIRALQRTLLCKKLPKSKYQTSKWFFILHRSPIFYSEVVKSWVALVHGPDPTVVKRSQYYFYTQENRRPVQFTPFVKLPGIIRTFAIVILGLIILILSQFRRTRKLLETYPRIFTLGVVSHAGPTRVEAESVDFKFTMVASGWGDKLPVLQDQHVEPPNKTLTLEVKGKNPGYAATATMLIESALTIVFEKEEMPSRGGVLTPGVAFEKTSLIDRLNARGVTFELQK